MFKRVMPGLALALLLAVSGAQAADRAVTVKIDGLDIVIPLPEGMCQATGPYAAAADQAAAIDKSNDTIITVFSCDLMSGKSGEVFYAMMKRPASTRGKTVERAAIVAEYKADPAAFKRAINAGANSSTAKEMMDKMMPPDSKVATGLTPDGADDDGIYVSGVSTVQNPQGPPTSIALGMGMTVVKGRMLNWNFYAGGDTAGVVAEQLRRARAATKALVKAN